MKIKLSPVYKIMRRFLLDINTRKASKVAPESEVLLGKLTAQIGVEFEKHPFYYIIPQGLGISCKAWLLF